MKTKKTNIEIEVISNPHGIVCFDDFINEAVKKFKIEMNAKNQAYDFILRSGLLSAFEEFCKVNDRENSHKKL